jgi:hypothetical protein
MFWKQISTTEAVDEFREQAQSFILQGDREGLKRLYAGLTAQACMSSSGAAAAMQQALRDEILRISATVRRGLFDDL